MGAGASAIGGGLGWPELESADCIEDVQALLEALSEEVQAARKEADRRTGEDGKPYTREQFESKFGELHKWDEAKKIDAKNQQLWSIGEFLGSDLGDIVSQAITPPVAQKDPLLQLAFARAVGQKGTVKAIKHLLEQQDVLTKIVTKILESTTKLCANKVATGQAMHDKFAMEGAFEFFFGGKPDYFGGLEPRIGPPSARVLEAMVKEHCDSIDSEAFASTSSEHYRLVAVAHVVPLRSSDNGDIQHAAKDMLEEIGKAKGQTEAEVIASILSARDAGDRKAACDTLGKLGEATVPHLAAVAGRLSDDVSVVRAAACEALGKHGEARRHAVAAAVEAIGTHDPDGFARKLLAEISQAADTTARIAGAEGEEPKK